jgi:AraC family transcriptional regulator
MHHLENEPTPFLYRVLEYIHCHLSGDLSLEKLASVASYSPFHFQRVFTNMVGESPKQYIIRLRLEKAARHIKVFPKLSLTEISYDSGFASLSTFSRAFKGFFGISPEHYKLLSPEEVRKICKTDSKNGKTIKLFSSDFWQVNFSQANMTEQENQSELTFKRQSEKRMYFMQTQLDSPDAITLAFQKLFHWADPRGLITHETQYIGLLLDVPFITPIEKCRYKVCITSDLHSAEHKQIGTIAMMPGLYASYSMKGDIYSLVKSLVYCNHYRLPNSGYSIREDTCFEIFEENPTEKPIEQIRREVLLPVRPA